MRKPAAPADTPLELFAAAPQIAAGTKEEIVHIALDEIEPDPANPRTDADDELAESIRQEGVLQAITVRPHPDPKAGKRYMIVYGERRWRGSQKAKRTTIPAVIRDEPKEDRARRLVKQFQENFHKKLDPNQEAKLLAEVRSATGFSVEQLAKISGKPKSTISDRLALADAPPAFAELFVAGHLTAAAAPIVKKFAEVPPAVLAKAVRHAEQSWEWRNHIRDGKAIPLGNVERVLKGALVGDNYNKGYVRELPEKMALLYQGPKIVIGDKEYATDVAVFDRAKKKHDEAEAAKAAEREKNAKKKTPAAPKLTAAQKKAAEKERKKRQAEEAKRALEEAGWRGAMPAIREAVAVAIKKVAASTLVGFFYDLFTKTGNYVDDCTFDKSESTKAMKLVPLGKSADDFLRHWLFAALERDFDEALEENGYSYARRNIVDRVKELGLKVDIKKLRADAEKAFKAAEAAKAKAAPAATKKKAKK